MESPLEFSVFLNEQNDDEKENVNPFLELIQLPSFPYETHSKDVFFTIVTSKALIDRIDGLLQGISETFLQFDFLSCRWNLLYFNGISHCYMVINLYNISETHNAIEFCFREGDFEFYKTIMWKLFFLHDGSYTCECNFHNHKIMFELPAQVTKSNILRDAMTDAMINKTMLKKTLSATLKNGHSRGVLEAAQVLCVLYKEDEEEDEGETSVKEEDMLCLRELMSLILRDKKDSAMHLIYALSVLKRLCRKKLFAEEITKNLIFVNAVFNWRFLPVESFIASIAVQQATSIFDILEEIIDTDCLWETEV